MRNFFSLTFWQSVVANVLSAAIVAVLAVTVAAVLGYAPVLTAVEFAAATGGGLGVPLLWWRTTERWTRQPPQSGLQGAWSRSINSPRHPWLGSAIFVGTVVGGVGLVAFIASEVVPWLVHAFEMAH